ANKTVQGNMAGGATDGFTAPTATDIVDARPVVTCDKPESGFYPVGRTTVGCTATDASGNVAKGSFTITVVDTIAPVITWVSTQPNAGWNKTDVTVTWSCSDIVGVKASQVSTTVTTEGRDQSATGTCTDTSNNTASQTVNGISIDKSVPILTISGPSQGSTIELCTAGSLTKPTFAPADTLSGLAAGSHDTWSTPTTASGVGTYVYSATATDNAGNMASESRTYKVVYGGSFGFAQPINSNGTSRFKLGSTVPVKFQLLCNGQPYSAAVAKLYVKAVDGTPDAGIDEAVSTAASTTGNLFRYGDGQYIFNLSTKAGYVNPTGTTTPFVSGTYTLTVTLDDGTYRSVDIQLVK
ncbi:MAG: PxKF domain-containing protein, partial [Actinobacteria bacterium]|nr:PxKF domain-containing protein [Actinomycetota bacterium]